MLCLCPESTDPSFNLALEEYLFKHKSSDYLLLYINSPSVIIGKHQVAHREADSEFVRRNGIPVYRRISGGGTVFHDLGNLNFTFIRQSTPGRQIDFSKYITPVVRFLRSLGIIAESGKRNDLLVDGLKISGNAEHVYRNRVLHHGTLLFDTNLSGLSSSIRKDTSSYITRGVTSNPSPVTNIKKLLHSINSATELKQKMLEYFLCERDNKIGYLEKNEMEIIRILAETKYMTWDWNYAYGPEYQFVKKINTGDDNYSVILDVKNGIIEKCNIELPLKLYIDEKRLTGCRHMAEDIINVFNAGNKPQPDELIGFFF